mgnify:CR=1 FL=1
MHKLRFVMPYALSIIILLSILVFFPSEAKSQGLCSVYKTFSANEILTASDLNNSLTTIGVTNQITTCIDGYSNSVAQMRTETDPGGSGSESQAVSLAGELERLRFTIRRLHGQTYWYTSPSPFNPPGDVAVGVAASRTNRVAFNHSGNSFTTGLYAGDMTQSADYFLPTAYPTASGQVLSSTTAGIMSWVSAPSTAATQAEMETATSTSVFVSPGRTQYHPGVAKMWGQWDDTGAITAQYNLTSITDTGVGDHTVVIGTDMSSGSYSVQGTVGNANRTISVVNLAGGSFDFDVYTDAGGATRADGNNWLAVAYGDQ